MKYKIKISLLILAVLSAALPAFLVVPNASAATSRHAEQAAVCSNANSFLGFSPWYSCLKGASDGDPDGGPDGPVRVEELDDLFLIILPLLESLVLAAAFVAAGMIFYNLIQFIIARGNAGKASTAMTGIRDAVIGFIIAMLSVAIVNFIAGSLT